MIQPSSNSEFYSANLDYPQQFYFKITHSKIESEENYFDLGLGFFQVYKDFFTVKEVKRDEIYDRTTNSVIECTFFMDNDLVIYKR